MQNKKHRADLLLQEETLASLKMPMVYGKEAILIIGYSRGINSQKNAKSFQKAS